MTELEKESKLLDEINKFVPAEIICNQSFMVCGIDIEDLHSGFISVSMRWKTGILMMQNVSRYWKNTSIRIPWMDWDWAITIADGLLPEHYSNIFI